MTGNVQLYLTDAERTPFRMSAPLGGFGLGVKRPPPTCATHT